jgi:hypothetical protein
VKNLITSYEKLGCNMSLEMFFLRSRLNSFPVNYSALSEESDGRFHQDLSYGEQIQGQIECCHISRLLLDGEERCSGNSVQATREKAPRLIHVTSYVLLPYNNIIKIFKPQPIL